jgi:2-methylisocitrate lyase-like PEP mutase family enzyme
MNDGFTRFAELHRPGSPLFLVNAWDVLSALALAAAGHPAIGTTSLGLTAGAGELDGARAGAEPTRRLTERLRGRLEIPVTVDAEDGYSDDPGAVTAFVEELASLGAVGVNLEDAARSPAEHARIIAAVVARVPGVFVNARTDVFWSGQGDIEDTLQRCRQYRDAGAHGLFVPGLSDPAAVNRIVAVGLPLNLLWRAVPDPAALGVARVSTGSTLYRIALSAAIAAANHGPKDRHADAFHYGETQALLSQATGRPNHPPAP